MIVQKSERTRADNLIVKGYVGGMDCHILLDTGAEANLLGDRLIRALGITKEQCRFDRTVITGAQSDVELKTLGVLEQVVEFQGRGSRFSRPVEFIATSEYRGDVILGKPILASWGVVLALDPVESVVTMRSWPDEHLMEAVIKPSLATQIADSTGFYNLRVERKRLWGMEIVDVVPQAVKDKVCKFYTKVSGRTFSKVISLAKDIVPTLNRLVHIEPTIVYMRFRKCSQLYHLLDLSVAIPLLFQVNEKVVGIASLVAPPARTQKWRTLMREGKKLDDHKHFLSKQVFPFNDDMMKELMFIVEHLKSLELSDNVEEQWKGDGKGDEGEPDDDDRLFPPVGSADVKAKSPLTRDEISQMVKCDNPRLKPQIVKLLLARVSLLGDPKTAKVVGYEHQIRLEPGTKGISAGREVPAAHRDVVRDEVKRLLEAKTIVVAPHGMSPFVSPVVIVPKKDEFGLPTKKRMCVDYRQLNKRTIRDRYALPNLEACLHLRSGKIFSKIDLASAFHQIPIATKDQVKTGFQAERQIYLWRYMPFGLSNAPATMQRLTDMVLGTAKDNYAQGYLDDIIIYSRNEEEHIEHLADILQRLHRHGLRIGLPKCEFGKDKIVFLGHLISHGVVGIDPSKVEGVTKLARPVNVKELQHVLGVTGWCRKFIYNYARITAPLTGLFKKDAPWIWGEEQDTAFVTLVKAISQAPILIQPDFSKPFILETDASDEGVGAVLLQRVGSDVKSEMKPISYISRKLTSAERQYSTREKEMLAIVWATERLQSFLWGRPFVVFTDHRSLIWVRQAAYDNSRIGRWARKLSSYWFDIKFRPGASNQPADGLSRHPVVTDAVRIYMNLRSHTKRASQQAKSKTPVAEPRPTSKRRRDQESNIDSKGSSNRSSEISHPAPDEKAQEAAPSAPKIPLKSIPARSGPEESKVSATFPSIPGPTRTPKEGAGERLGPTSGVVAGPSVPIAESKVASPEVVATPTPLSSSGRPRDVVEGQQGIVQPGVLLSTSSTLIPSSIPVVGSSAPVGDDRKGLIGGSPPTPSSGAHGGPAGSGPEVSSRAIRRRTMEPTGDSATESLSIVAHDESPSEEPVVRPGDPAPNQVLSDEVHEDLKGLDKKWGSSRDSDKKVEVFDDSGLGEYDLSQLLATQSKTVTEGSEKKIEKIYEIPDQETWRRLLLQDSTYGKVIQFLLGKVAPTSRLERDRLNTLKMKYTYEGGLLYFHRTMEDGSERRLVEVPEVCRRNLVRLYHDGPMAGHRKEEAMIKLIRQHYNWPSLRKDIKEYVQGCLRCFLAKTPNPAKQGLLVQWGTRVEKFTVIHIDFVGPIPYLGKKDERYVFTIKDRGTGMLEAVPLHHKSAEEAATALWKFWFCRFGIPKLIISDQDASFRGTLFTGLSKCLGYDSHMTTAYHPQANGLLERDHRTLKAYLNTCCLGTPSSWSEKLSTFCFVVNSTPRDHFTYSPFFLAFGVDPRVPAMAMDKTLDVHDVDEYIAGLQLQLSDAREVAIRERLASEARQKKQYDRFHYETKFAVGDIVFKRVEQGRGTASKFWIPWRGPYKVVKRHENGVDWTVLGPNQEEECVHVSKLACFRPKTDAPLVLSEDLTLEEEKIVQVLEDWRREQYADDYGHVFALDELPETKSGDVKERVDVEPLKPKAGLELELKKDTYLLISTTGFEELVQVLQPETLQCRLFKPVSKKDSGMSRMFAKLHLDNRDKKYWVANKLSPKIAPHCVEVVTEVDRARILYAFPDLERRRIPENVYHEFEKVYGRMPTFRQQA